LSDRRQRQADETGSRVPYRFGIQDHVLSKVESGDFRAQVRQQGVADDFKRGDPRRLLPRANGFDRPRAGSFADAFDFELTATTASLFTVLPYKVESIELAVAAETATATISVADGEVGRHVVRFDVLDVAGNPVPDAGANIETDAGVATWQPGPLPEGARVVARDVASGMGAI
jgi:hypothetical protein